MPRNAEAIREERRQLKKEYGQLYDSISALLFSEDPVGINFEVNTDEYAPEVSTILPRLRTCNSTNDVLRVVHEEFVRWFGEDTAGPQESYEKIASGIWEVWQVKK